MGVHAGKPPFDLVQLSSIDESLWRGLPVFGGIGQIGDVVCWSEKEFEAEMARVQPTWKSDPEADDETKYDVGIIYEWWSDDVSDPYKRVRYITSDGSTFTYASCFLWVPAELAKRLM